MTESKIAPLSGVAFTALLILAFLIDMNTEFMPSEADLVAHLEAGPLRVMASAYVMALAAGTLVWFGASLRQSLRAREGDDRLGTVALSGVVFAASVLAVGAAAMVGAAERVLVRDSIEPASASALLDLASISIGNAVPIGMAVAIAATSIVMLRTARSRRWAGILSMALAIGLLTPYAWLFLAGALVWFPAAGVVIYRSEPQNELAPVA